MTCSYAAGDAGELAADEDEMFLHSFYWDVLQDPALTVQVCALVSHNDGVLWRMHTRRAPSSWLRSSSYACTLSPRSAIITDSALSPVQPTIADPCQSR